MRELNSRIVGAVLVTVMGLAGILFSVVRGLLMDVPDLPVLRQSIRVFFYHVPMWFAMVFLFTEVFVRSFISIVRKDLKESLIIYWEELLFVAMWSGIMGLLTGMVWAAYTWGAPWHGDPKQNAALFALFLIAGFFIFKKMLPEHNRVRILAVYNLIAFVMSVWLIFVFPRTVESLHPGAGGNPAFNVYDTEDVLKPVFYTASIAWIIFTRGFAELRILARLKSCTNG